MLIPTKKLSVAIGVVLVVLVGAVGYAIINKPVQSTIQTEKKPTSKAESHFLLNEIYYDCSKPVEGNWVEASIGPMADPGYYFQPTNQEEFKKYCREGAIIEYRAVLDILRKEDVDKIIEKYNTSEAWVKALGHKYIHDKGYLDRILPAYSSMKIDCIIVVHSPEGTRFFIENGEKHESHNDHEYVEVTDTEFLTSLNKAPDQDITAFWLGLH